MRLRILLLCAFAIGLPSASFSQGDTRVLVIPSAVIAFHHPDDTYNSPYLDKHLGGFGWGGAFSVLAERRNLVVGGEINTARHAKVLTGRLVSGLDEHRSPIPTRVSFQESFVAALFGYSTRERNVHLLGGPAITLGTPQNEVGPRNPAAPKHWLALTGGMNWLVPSFRQVQFAIGARYFYVFETRGEFAGIGLAKHVFRANVGVSFASPK